MLISVQNSYIYSVRQLISVLLLASSLSLAQTGTRSYDYESIAAAYRAGKYQEAEQILRQLLERQPGEIRALSLMGAVLDAQKRYEEAENYYKRALKVSPNSPVLYNNLGNHYLAQGLTGKAEEAFMRVIKADPRHVNANLQLVSINVSKKDGKAALRYLGQVPPSEQVSIPFRLLKAQALYWAGQKTEAANLIKAIEQQATGDPRIAFSIGMAYVATEQFEEAEKAFGQALEVAPGNFEILYNLGLAATRAGHFDRAEEVFQVALKQRPDDPDVLLGLAQVKTGKKNYFSAAALLVKARQSEPKRAEIHLLLADCFHNLSLFGDEALTYDAYLKLRPEQDSARRDRGFALLRSGKWEEGLKDLEWYVKNHPEEARGYYLLGAGEAAYDLEKALEYLNHALKLKPDFLEARFSRGAVLIKLARPAEAVIDLQFLLKQRPDDPHALDQLGRAYLQMDQLDDAIKALKKATELAPEDPTVFFQYSLALRKLGRTEEMNQALARFRELRGGKARNSRAVLLEYLSLPSEQQRSRYLSTLQEELRESPQNFEVKVRLAKALLEEDKTADAIRLFEEIRQSSSDGRILARCGHILIEFEQYEAAKSMLETARKTEGFPKESLLDLTLAIFRVSGPAEGLKLLDELPMPDRNGDYFLLRAQLLDASDRFEEAVGALNESFHSNPTRVDLYLQASQFLIKHERYKETIDLLHQASSFIRDVPEIHLAEAMTLILMKKVEEGREKLYQIQSRWPEWYLPYLINGINLQNRRQATEAKPQLETAIALGAGEASAYYYLALATMELSPNDHEGVYQLVSQALKISPDDPYILSLSGRNALARKDYVTAAKHLQEAVRLSPDLIEAHYALSRLYRATGDRSKLEVELAETERLTKLYLPGEQIPAPLRDLLFTVRQPAQRGEP